MTIKNCLKLHQIIFRKQKTLPIPYSFAANTPVFLYIIEFITLKNRREI